MSQKQIKKSDIVINSKFNHTKITISKHIRDDNIQVFYGGKPLLLHTGVLECPHGIDYIEGRGYGQLTIFLNEDTAVFNTLNMLDTTARLIGEKCSNKLFGTEMTATEVPYYQLINLNEADSTISLKLFVEYRDGLPNLPVFGRDGSRLTDPRVEIGNCFSSSYLVHFEGLSVKDGYMRWNYSLKQIRIRQSSRLPPGCLITDDEDHVENVLSLRRKADQDTMTFDVVSESDEEEMTNELLD